jgi:hypothetical protein
MDESAVKSALHEVAARDVASGASEDVRRRLMAEVRAMRVVRRRRHVVVAGVAALLAIATSAALWRVVNGPSSAEPVRIDVQVAPTADEVATDFLPLIYSNVPTAGRRIVRVEVPRNALRSFGLASFDLDARSPASPTVVADLVVGDDGLARAVRFVAEKPQEKQQ